MSVTESYVFVCKDKSKIWVNLEKLTLHVKRLTFSDQVKKESMRLDIN